MALKRVRLVAIVEIIIGMIALFLFFKYGSSLDEVSCGFAYAIKYFYFLAAAVLLILGILTLLLHP